MTKEHSALPSLGANLKDTTTCNESYRLHPRVPHQRPVPEAEVDEDILSGRVAYVLAQVLRQAARRVRTHHHAVAGEGRDRLALDEEPDAHGVAAGEGHVADVVLRGGNECIVR